MKPASRLSLFAAALVFTGCAAQTPSATFSAADEAEVRGIFDSTVARIMRSDWTAWSTEFNDDAIFHPSNAKTLTGRPAILAWGQSYPPIEALSMSDVRVVGEGNLAYGTSGINIKIKDGPADTLKQLVVFQRGAAGKWEVVAVSVNSDLPLPGPAPATPPKK